MHHSTCLSTSDLVFIVLVLLFRTISLIVPLIPTFAAYGLLTCSSAFLDVSSIDICRTPTVRARWPNLLHWWHLEAHGPSCVSSASVLPLVRLLLVLIVLRSVIQPLLVLSLAFN
uniref:Uncharacterized protein n=1 Tax=Tanacetum cinerariifolium TaxID=118510 RepID=A0A699Q9A5_TANCI|nr:hypothetical protein [Tanacetum cinerariifolium]